MKGHRAAKGRSEPKADGGCGGSSSWAASVLKWGRGSGASGGGRRAAATPNMHSLATAAVSDWAARPRPRTSLLALRFGLLLGPCVEPGAQLLLPSVSPRPQPPSSPRLGRGGARPHFARRPALVASCVAFRVLLRPRGLVPRPERRSRGRDRPFLALTDSLRGQWRAGRRWG